MADMDREMAQRYLQSLWTGLGNQAHGNYSTFPTGVAGTSYYVPPQGWLSWMQGPLAMGQGALDAGRGAYGFGHGMVQQGMPMVQGLLSQAQPFSQQAEEQAQQAINGLMGLLGRREGAK